MRHNFKLLSLFTLVLFFASCSNVPKTVQSDIAILPRPVMVESAAGSFLITESTSVYYSGSSEVKNHVSQFLESLAKASGMKLELSELSSDSKAPKGINFIVDTNSGIAKEGYEIAVSKKQIQLSASTVAGLFYAIQTLRQLLPSAIESETKQNDIIWNIPALTIKDHPRFEWRGMMLDCCRHFMEKDFVKRYIDLLAYHKMNKFHWHLTEDQGWRIEIKKYPELTAHGAWRIEDDGSVYGGFYTQDDIREIVAYAQSKHIDVIPEIELPGHSVAAVSTFPYLSCTGDSIPVNNRWGVHKDVYCAGKETTFEFLQNVMDEVVELFPYEYIHIGGDESPKFRWENCNNCQNRIKEEGLKDEHELQSYFITRMEKYLNAKGRRIIGWDEILEGGLAPSATVQAWRGFDGAMEAAKQGHDAIVSPTSHAYFDYSIETTDLKQVYSFEPIPEGLDSSLHKHILGGECNMWTERAPQAEIDDRMFPRLLAMSEVLWSQAAQRDFSHFHKRVQSHYKRLDYLGVKYGFESKAVAVDASYNKETEQFEINLIPGQAGYDVYYTLDGSQPTLESLKFSEPITISTSAQLKAFATKGLDGPQKFIVQDFNKHLAIAKTVALEHPYSPNYTGTVNNALVDGLRGTINFRDGKWQGFFGEDLVATIDLDEKQSFSKITVSCLQSTPSWIFMPKEIEVFASVDNSTFRSLGKVVSKVDPMRDDIFIQDFEIKFGHSGGRYIKVIARNFGVNPEWHDAAGSDCWLFADEILVE